jgi:hypothetical protein
VTISTARIALVLVAATAFSAAPAAGGEASRPLDASAKRVSDAFVHALVVKHSPVGAKLYTSARIEDLRRLSAGFVRDGIGSVVGPSRILHACRATLREKPSPRGDCIRYRLRGIRRVGRGQRVTDADFRIWLRQEMNAWKVWAYNYSATVTACPSNCR